VKRAQSYHIKVLLLLAIIVGTLSGCGVKLVYNQLDWLIPWYVDDYISLNGQQQAELQKRLSHVLQWHRTTQLTEYTSFLRKTRNDLSHGLSEEKIDRVMLAFEDSYRTIMRKVAPEMVDMLLSSTDEQKAELYENLAAKNQEYYEEYIEPGEEARLAKRIENTRKSIKRWVGPLTEQQQAIVDQYARDIIPMDKVRLQYRQLWQSHFRQLLNQGANDANARVELEQLLIDPRDLYSEKYLQKRAANITLVKEMLLQLYATLTEEQKNHFADRLEHYAEVFEELSVET
jgi:hypothetical protein